MKRIKKFSTKPFRALQSHLKTLPFSHDAETLHKVRVDIKKIKAVLQVVDEGQKKFNPHKQFLPFRVIFRKADAIRQSEVLTSLLSKYPEEGSPVPQTESPTLTTFESDVPAYLHTVKAQTKKLKPYLKKIQGHDIRQYLNHQYKKIEAKLYPRLSLKDIHKTRKSIKAALYVAGAVDRLNKKKENFFDTLQEAIGNLHDKQVLLERLKKNGNDHDHRALRSACARDIRQIRLLSTAFYS